MKIKYVICINDYPFAVLDSTNEQEANEIRDEIQAKVDNRKKSGTIGNKLYVHVQEVPIISTIEDIVFAEWDTHLPTIK